MRSQEKRSTEQSNNSRFEKLIFNKQYQSSMKYKEKKSTKEFARDFKRVFKNNWELFHCEKAIIQDLYILLLFEIGRRLVREEAVEQAIKTKQSLDKLPISTTIIKSRDYWKRKGAILDTSFIQMGNFSASQVSLMTEEMQ